MVKKLYMYADQGDITLDSPEALREKTSGCAVVTSMSFPQSSLSFGPIRGPRPDPVGRPSRHHPDVIW